MAGNMFGIPEDAILRLRSRDKNCVYCGKRMIQIFDTTIRSECASIEHLNCGGPFDWQGGRRGLKEEDLVLCCGSCNSSRGRKTLWKWFESTYCIARNINSATVAAPVKRYLRTQKSHREG